MLQINQLIEAQHTLNTEHATIKQAYQMKLYDNTSVANHDNLQQENQLLRNAIDQWSNRYDDLKSNNEQMKL